MAAAGRDSLGLRLVLPGEYATVTDAELLGLTLPFEEGYTTVASDSTTP